MLVYFEYQAHLINLDYEACFINTHRSLPSSLPSALTPTRFVPELTKHINKPSSHPLVAFYPVGPEFCDWYIRSLLKDEVFSNHAIPPLESSREGMMLWLWLGLGS